MKRCKIVVFKNKKGKWQFRGVWANGEIGFHSEVYTTKHGAVKSAKKLWGMLGASWDLIGVYAWDLIGI